MTARIFKLDAVILKQAVRDVASKNPDISDKAIIYFYSDDFLELCQRNNMDGQSIMRSVKDLSKYPIISRKKIANRIAKIIDKFTKKEVL